ncbi:DegT/DnrJ/EryC1/StrS aminotransferase family protein [Spirosoma aureum]|uniref:DegT/DnrJ/EryC1/StrS aminotransferase family protein n=1 Tax=Spirosoma aureum TaxID=2692134 RepID=A0A6G9ANL1_9BACT|nr:DegT/DnrJ/EryC1/StrS family aminotransferase [Spirosoma aureum]QIP13914.1 DegT/DnrJ/EryC1/StrS aminotransferase family protein [Spirosoma aureum]
MIPRFNYSYSLRDTWDGITGLLFNKKPNTSYLNDLFPGAAIYFVDSARMGIKYALLAFNLKPGAKIGIQPYTCSSMLAAIAAANCRPVFIDINEQLSLDCDDLRRKLTGLDALIITHTFGIPANITQIKQLTGQLPVIEDCAHAFHSWYEGIHAGNFFDAAVFSFGNGKFPSVGGGGLLVINRRKSSERVAGMLGKLKSSGLVRELTFAGRQLVNALIHSRVGESTLYYLLNENFLSNKSQQISDYPTHERQPYRSVGYAMQRQFTELAIMSMKQRENARYLIDRQNSHYKMLANVDDAGNSFAIVLLSHRRNELYNFLRKKGIGAGKHFQHAKSWAMQFGYQHGECPNFEQIVGEILTIPCHYGMISSDLQKIDQCLNEFTQSNNLTR